MDRLEFLKTLGLSSAAIVFIDSIESCKKPDPVTPAKVDFTFSTTDTNYAALIPDGGYIYLNGVIVANTGGGNYIALSRACTHQGCDVIYELPQNDFLCPCHNSIFSATGSRVSGPAMTALTKYNVTVSGTDVRVFQ